VAQVRRQTVFTLHTPLPAGNETFELGLVQRYLADRLFGIDAGTLASLGTIPTRPPSTWAPWPSASRR